MYIKFIIWYNLQNKSLWRIKHVKIYKMKWKKENIKMIIDYEPKYDEQVKELLVELQKYIVDIDKEHFNIITEEYREEYFKETIESVKKQCRKNFII